MVTVLASCQQSASLACRMSCWNDGCLVGMTKVEFSGVVRVIGVIATTSSLVRRYVPTCN